MPEGAGADADASCDVAADAEGGGVAFDDAVEGGVGGECGGVSESVCVFEHV